MVVEREADLVFVGRDRELATLVGGLDQARSGRGGLFLLEGPPGIGKSRLADELARHAREHGVRVLWGRAWEGGGAPPYWPWVQALRSYLRSVEPDEVRSHLSPAAAADVAQILPEVGTLFADLPTAPSTDPESARFRLFDAAAAFVTEIGRDAAMVVIIDDLHAADTPSILFLQFLGSQLGDSRAMVVATYRDVALTPGHPLQGALPELAREPTTRLISVTGLTERAVGQVIESVAGPQHEPDLARVLHRETAGNPLFVGEALRLLAAEGRLEGGVDPTLIRLTVPAGVREVITRRVGQLPEPAVNVMTLAAVLGPEFGLEQLRRVGRYGRDELLEILEHPLRAGLLVPAAGTPYRFRFSHGLVRETLYDELGPAQRVALHRQVAEALEEHYAALGESHLAELAYHFFEVSRGGEASRAVEYARRAAAEAATSLAYEEAARLYALALEASEIDDSTDDEQRVELLLALGDAQARAGDLDRARATFLRAAAIARRTGAATQLARAALGYGGRFVWARAGDDPHTVRLLQDALVLLGGGDDRLRVRLLARLACALRSSPDRALSDALSAQALEMAHRLDDAPTLAYALEGRMGAIWWPETPVDRLELSEEAIRLALEIGDLEREATGRMGAWCALIDLCRISEAREHAAILWERVPRLRQPAQRWLAAAIRAQMHLMLGDFSEAEPIIQEYLGQRLHPTAVADDLSAATAQLFILRREQGRLAEVEPRLRKAAETFSWYPLHRAALAVLLSETGQAEEAQQVFAGLARDEFAALYRDNQWLLGMAWVSEACAMLGHRGAAAELYAQLAPFAGRHAVGHAEGSLGVVDRYLGLLAWTAGRPADAEAHLRDAVRLNELAGFRPWTAHAQHDLARLLIEERLGPAEARDVLEAAADTARSLSMIVLEARIAGLRGHAEDGSLSAADAAPGPAGGTFRREGDYWTVRYLDHASRIRDSKGMRYLARLLARPGAEIHALDLAAGGASLAPGSGTSADLDLPADGLGDAGPRLDAEAKSAYRSRIEELRAELADAEAANDVERAHRARVELDFLTTELSRSLGLGGRDRTAGSAAERARLSVTRAIRAAMARIEGHNPKLHEHLRATIRTGTYCSYTPDPRLPPRWEL